MTLIHVRIDFVLVGFNVKIVFINHVSFTYRLIYYKAITASRELVNPKYSCEKYFLNMTTGGGTIRLSGYF